MYKKILLSLSGIVVFWQLASIAFVFPMENFSYGPLSQKTEIDKNLSTHHPRIARNVSGPETEYESIVFVGDVLLARNVEHLMQQKGNEYPFAKFSLTALTPTPAVVGNFESSMSPTHRQTPPYMMKFSVSETFLPALKNAGFTHLSLANNHSSDFGSQGYEHALQSLSDFGFTAFGHGTTLSSDSISYVKTTQGTIALIGIHASEREPNQEELEQLLNEATLHSYMQIVFIHWGTEYVLIHSKVQEKIARTLVAAGADAIIGHHPHVVQDVALIDDVVVFYSLGNYIFDQYFSSNTQEGLVVLLSELDEPEFNLIPVTSEESLSQPALMEPQSHQAFLARLAKRSDPRLQVDILNGIIPLKRAVATSTEMAIMMP